MHKIVKMDVLTVVKEDVPVHVKLDVIIYVLHHVKEDVEVAVVQLALTHAKVAVKADVMAVADVQVVVQVHVMAVMAVMAAQIHVRHVQDVMDVMVVAEPAQIIVAGHVQDVTVVVNHVMHLLYTKEKLNLEHVMVVLDVAEMPVKVAVALVSVRR